MNKQKQDKTSKHVTRKEYKRRARNYFIAGAILLTIDAFIFYILRTY